MSKDELDRMAKGKLFHKNGPEREKARSPSVVINTVDNTDLNSKCYVLDIQHCFLGIIM